jgi:hypothetical protein
LNVTDVLETLEYSTTATVNIEQEEIGLLKQEEGWVL